MGKRILALDPGSRAAGFGVIEFSGKSFRYIASGVLDIHGGDDFLDRLGKVPHLMSGLISDHGPDEIALESLIFVKSPTALIKLAQVRGAMVSALSQTHQGKVFEYSPNLIKSTVTGHGLASKEEVQRALTMMLKVREFKTHDESDALAVAICHALHSNRAKKQIDKELSKSKKSLYKAKRSMSSSLTHKIENKDKR